MGLKKIEIEQLRKELSELKSYSPTFKAIRDEMKSRGHWKNKPRGKKFEGQSDPRVKKLAIKEEPVKKIVFGNLLNGQR
jgi:hypothetical protein